MRLLPEYGIKKKIQMNKKDVRIYQSKYNVKLIEEISHCI